MHGRIANLVEDSALDGDGRPYAGAPRYERFKTRMPVRGPMLAGRQVHIQFDAVDSHDRVRRNSTQEKRQLDSDVEAVGVELFTGLMLEGDTGIESKFGGQRMRASRERHAAGLQSDVCRHEKQYSVRGQTSGDDAPTDTRFPEGELD